MLNFSLKPEPWTMLAAACIHAGTVTTSASLPGPLWGSCRRTSSTASALRRAATLGRCLHCCDQVLGPKCACKCRSQGAMVAAPPEPCWLHQSQILHSRIAHSLLCAGVCGTGARAGRGAQASHALPPGPGPRGLLHQQRCALFGVGRAGWWFGARMHCDGANDALTFGRQHAAASLG